MGPQEAGSDVAGSEDRGRAAETAFPILHTLPPLPHNSALYKRFAHTLADAVAPWVEVYGIAMVLRSLKKLSN